jgi:cell division transport system ATP-binding protein
MVELKHVTKSYGKVSPALKDVSFKINPGEFASLVGQSGVGKTTLVKLLIAEEKPNSGEIIIGGWDITKIRNFQKPQLRKQIGVVWQDYKLLPKKTVYENVSYALQVSGAPRLRIQEIVPQVLNIVGLKDKYDRYPHQLSGGEQQRTAIARALVHRPKLLVADEPTGNLDTINSREVIDILLKINDFGATVLLVSHDREIVNSINKRVITLDKGVVISDQMTGKYIL